MQVASLRRAPWQASPLRRRQRHAANLHILRASFACKRPQRRTCPAYHPARRPAEDTALHSSIYTLPDDLAKVDAPGVAPAPVQVRASSPSFGAWSPDGKLLACSVRERIGVLSSSYTATAVLVSSAALLLAI